jgi:phosphoribosylamine--glycine ligase
MATCVAIGSDDISALLDFARRQAIDLTVVGPEAPLTTGIVDTFSAAELKIFGPTAAAAALEGSKVFAKNLMAKYGIPTGSYQSFTDPRQALAYLDEIGVPCVVKADGLAAGKGVTVAMTIDEAAAALRALFAEPGAEVVIEEFMEGEEVSLFALSDGTDVLLFGTAQDHKRIGEGDTGPNTGGMGAYSPAPVVTPEVHARVMREVVEPTVRGMLADGIPFTGFLYAGLMIDASGAPRVIEFNVRFGDPETQPVMLRLQSDLVDLLEAAIDGRLDQVEAQWDPRPSLGVVMASRPYPDTPATGDVISGLDAVPATAKVFHAGTALDESGRVLATGGRVLCVAALGDSVQGAQRNAYAGVAAIAWNSEFHRTDIGWRAIARERQAP